MTTTLNALSPTRRPLLEPYAVLDTAPEAEFDVLARLAAKLCAAPIALVSLIDDDRQWFKARVGTDVCETDLSRSVCVHGLAADDLLVIPDLRLDPRTRDNPLVADDPHIRFYAGAPLRVADTALGMLCVIDTVPRPEGLTQAQRDALVGLARQVVANLELRRVVRERDDQLAALGLAQGALISSEARWRGLFAAMSDALMIGEVVRDRDGRVVDWRCVEANDSWAEMMGLSAEAASAWTVRNHFPDGERDWIDDFAAIVDTRRPRTFSRHVAVSRRWYEGRGFAIESERFAVIFRDVTDSLLAARRQAAIVRITDAMRQAETVSAMTTEVSAIVGEALQVSRAGFGRLDPSGETVVVEPDWTAPGVSSVAGRHRFSDFGEFGVDVVRGETVVITDARSDPRTRADPQPLLDIGVAALVNAPVRSRGRVVAFVLVHDDAPREWAAADIEFLSDVADRLTSGVARLDAEAQQAILNAELSHRLKNTLAMVQAIASQTLKGANDRAPLEAFEQRLQALGSAHEALFRRNWASADMRSIVEGALGVVGNADRIGVDGPPLSLGVRAAMSTSLVVHELATNAAKYGALSVDGGRVDIVWQVVDDRVRFDWRERGGPPVAPPTRSGFGSRLLRLGLVGTGGATIHYDAMGLNAAMIAPLDEISEI